MESRASHESPSEVYGPYAESDLILRDQLAIDRTILANERTFLAYLRTALTMLVAGISFIKFFGSVVVSALGWAFVVLAVPITVIGALRYARLKGALARVGHRESGS